MSTIRTSARAAGAAPHPRRLGLAALARLDRGLLGLAALEVAGEVVDVHYKDERARGEVRAEVPGPLQQQVHRPVVPLDQVVHEVSPDAELGLQPYPVLAELRLEDAPGPVEEDYVLGFEGLALEVNPQVAGRGAGADRGPEELVVLDA